MTDEELFGQQYPATEQDNLEDLPPQDLCTEPKVLESVPSQTRTQTGKDNGVRTAANRDDMRKPRTSAGNDVPTTTSERAKPPKPANSDRAKPPAQAQADEASPATFRKKYVVDRIVDHGVNDDLCPRRRFL